MISQLCYFKAGPDRKYIKSNSSNLIIELKQRSKLCFLVGNSKKIPIIYNPSTFDISLCSGVPAGSQCHHPQFAAGTSAVESHHAQVGSPGRTKNHHMTGPASGTNGSSGTLSKPAARLKRKVLIVHLERLTAVSPRQEHQTLTSRELILFMVLFINLCQNK